MISEQRLADLHFQADNNGLTREIVKRMEREGKKPDPMLSPMVVVSPSELRVLLDNYKEQP